jgi:hypothetical protein
MTFVPNDKAVYEAVASMLQRQVGGGYQTIEDCMWWASAHAYDGYDKATDNGRIFWLAVYAKLREIYNHGVR